jgi:hypothetical protein
MRLKSIAVSSVLGALVYSSGFWGVELLSCATQSGCETRGDVTALILVLLGFLLVAGIVLALYLYAIKRLLDGASGTGLHSRVVLITASILYCFVGTVIGFWVFADPSSFFQLDGFWINALIGSACFAAYLGTLGIANASTAQSP